jgi:hypothetical protein
LPFFYDYCWFCFCSCYNSSSLALFIADYFFSYYLGILYSSSLYFSICLLLLLTSVFACFIFTDSLRSYINFYFLVCIGVWSAIFLLYWAAWSYFSFVFCYYTILFWWSKLSSKAGSFFSASLAFLYYTKFFFYWINFLLISYIFCSFCAILYFFYLINFCYWSNLSSYFLLNADRRFSYYLCSLFYRIFSYS